MCASQSKDGGLHICFRCNRFIDCLASLITKWTKKVLDKSQWSHYGSAGRQAASQAHTNAWPLNLSKQLGTALLVFRACVCSLGWTNWLGWISFRFNEITFVTNLLYIIYSIFWNLTWVWFLTKACAEKVL